MSYKQILKDVQENQREYIQAIIHIGIEHLEDHLEMTEENLIEKYTELGTDYYFNRGYSTHDIIDAIDRGYERYVEDPWKDLRHVWDVMDTGFRILWENY